MNYLICRSHQQSLTKNSKDFDECSNRSTKFLLDCKDHHDRGNPKNSKRTISRITSGYWKRNVLGHLIAHRRYDAAIRRLKKEPWEASIWVTTETSHASGTSRQLPIHMVCSRLSTRLSDRARSRCEQLLRYLALTFPDGCAHRDHEQRLPLHEAIRYDASPETIALLLVVFPEALDVTDVHGRFPRDLGSHCHDIAYIMGRDKDFWRSKRKELYKDFQNDPEKCCSKEFLHLKFAINDRQLRKDKLLCRSKRCEWQKVVDDERKERFDKKVNIRKCPQSTDPLLAERHELTRLRALENEYAAALANESLARRVVKLEKEKSQMRLRIEQMVTILNSYGLASNDCMNKVLSRKTGFKAKIAQHENKKITHNDKRRKGVAYKADVVEAIKRQSKLYKFPRTFTIREEAKQDIVFLPDNYDNDISRADGLQSGSNDFQQGKHAHRTQCNMGLYVQDDLDSLLDVAERCFGHTFSDATIQAWRRIQLPDDRA